MLSTQQYEQIARSLRFPDKAYIDGKFQPASTGRKFVTTNPANGAPIAELPLCDASDVDRAVAAARHAFNDGRWSGLHPSRRKECLLRFSALILEHQAALSVMESLDSGKPIYDTELTDIPESAACFAWHAEAADKLEDTITATGPDVVSMVVRSPIGVVAAILPWNFPLMMAAWKLAPILASGNCAVVKPAQLTSLTLLHLAELAEEAGIPAGVLNVVTGAGAEVGNALAMHPDVDLIAFTGSTEVGRNLLSLSGQSNLKRVLLELGGKNPCVVMPDIADRDEAARQIVSAALWNMGENCSANSRILIHADILRDMSERIRREAANWKVGNPLDPEVQNGPLISRAHMQAVLAHIEQARSDGAKCVFGGTQILEETGGNFISPTLFAGVMPSMRIFREEVFGPVFSITAFHSIEEAIAMANDTEYGLHASVWSENMRDVQLLSSSIRAGTISVNCYSEGDMGTPFGGFKQSGFFGRDKSLWANRQYTELKTVWIQAKR